MARAKNPERIAREDMVTRTVTAFRFTFRFVPKGGNSIENGTCTFYGNEQSATRKATAHAKTLGTLLDGVVLETTKSALIAMNMDKFIENGKVLETYDEKAAGTENNSDEQ